MTAKVLVSDDEKIWREDIIRDALCEAGYVVHTAESIEETIDKLHREFFHLVTVDLSFSEDHSIKEGRRTMQLLKTLNEGTKAIVLTGYGSVDSAVEALKEFEVFHFLQKAQPFEEEKFLDIMKEAARQVQISSVNYRLTISVETVISGFRLHDIASTIGEKESEIRWVVLNLMNDVVPAILPYGNGELIQTGAGRVFKRPLWSRILGKPLTIAFGSPEAMEVFCSTGAEIVKRNSGEKAVGCLLEAHDLRFEDFPKPSGL